MSTHAPETVGGGFVAYPDRRGLRESVGAALREHGVAGLAGLRRRDDVLAAADALMSRVWPHRDSSPDGLTMIRDTGRHADRPGFMGLGRGEVLAHTEGTQIPQPPRLMLLACMRPGDAGGESLIVDGAAVLADLAAQHPTALEALSAPRAAFFGGSDGRFTPVFNLLPSGRWEIRLRQDDLARFSPEAEMHLPALRVAIARHTRQLRLAAGQAVVLDNHRTLHARTAFVGERLLLRALGTPRPQLGLGTGFPAPQGTGAPARTLDGAHPRAHVEAAG